MWVLQRKLALKNLDRRISFVNYLLLIAVNISTGSVGRACVRKCIKNRCYIEESKANKALNACFLFCHDSCISSDNTKFENTVPLGSSRPSPWAIALISAWSLSIFAVSVLIPRAQLSCWVVSAASVVKLNACIKQKSAKTQAFIQELIVTVLTCSDLRRSASAQCRWKVVAARLSVSFNWIGMNAEKRDVFFFNEIL